MAGDTRLQCDGCGQTGPPEHIALRLQRLEWATRYRPVHIQTLLLGGVAPREDAEFLYTPGGDFRGERENLLRAIGIEIGRPPFEIPFEARGKQGKQMAAPTTASPAERTVEAIHSKFQAAGFFLAHILECPVEPHTSAAADANARANASTLLREHLPSVASRIRRSLKPKRVMLVTEIPQEVVQDVLALDLGCEVILNDGRAFDVAASVNEAEIGRFRTALDGRAMR